MYRAAGSGADSKENPEIDRIADTHLPLEKRIGIMSKPLICPLSIAEEYFIFCHEGIPTNQDELDHKIRYYKCRAWVTTCAKNTTCKYDDTYCPECEFSKPHCRRLE